MPMIEERRWRRRMVSERSIFRRAATSLALVVIVMALGTIGFHYIEGWPYLNSFYNMAMLATGEGPAATPATPTGLIFASVMAFVGVGSVVIALVYLFGPFFRDLLRIGERDVRMEERAVSRDIRRYEKGRE